METFKTLKSQLRWMGILRRDSVSGIVAVILDSVMFGVCISYAVTTGSFTLFRCRTFEEYMESVFIFLSSMMVTLWYSVFLWQKQDFNRLFVDLDAIIEKSKFRLVF